MIYIEKPVKPIITAAQILGIILLSCSVLCFVLFACFGSEYYLEDVFILCLPVALWGVICLLTKQPLLWCAWCGSSVWWIYMFVLSAKWEKEFFYLFVGIALVAISFLYTIYLHNKKGILIPMWGWILLITTLTVAFVLLMLNLTPPVAGTVTHPTEIVSHSIS